MNTQCTMQSASSRGTRRWRRWAPAMSAVAALTCLPFTRVSAADAPAAPAPDVQITPYHVQGNVWLLAGEVSNVVVQIGDEGVLVVDTGLQPLAEKLLAQIQKLANGKIIRFVINTHMHADHTGGNEVIRKAGNTILAGNVARDDIRGQQGATVLANENVLVHMSEQDAKGNPAVPTPLWPTETHTEDIYNIYFNGEAIQLFHPHNAHTDGDTYVLFRRSDVIVTGDIFVTTTYPIIDLQHGGTINGIVDALDNIIDMTVPADKQEGGTYVVPGHGRVCDQADLVEYRDMTTIIRDRIQDMINKGKTLEQVRAAKPTADYDGRFGASSGFWTTDKFIDAVYHTLKPVKAGKSKAKAGE
jgi:cyclase